MRERKDEVILPIIGNGIPKRVEKKREAKKQKKHFNIIHELKHETIGIDEK